MHHLHSTRWQPVLQHIHQHLHHHHVEPTRALVLLPYAQLQAVARAQWLQLQPQGLLPRFTTTSDWAAHLQAFLPASDDIALDAAQDVLTAHSLLRRASATEGEARWLTSAVHEAALQLAPVAAAQPPSQRLTQWLPERLQTMRELLSAGELSFEAKAAQVALAWAGSSAYPSDALWAHWEQQVPAALVVVHGYQTEPLVQALVQAWNAQHPKQPALELHLPHFWPLRDVAQPKVRWHVLDDPESQVMQAAACIQAAVQRHAGLVALVDNDRAVTRRIRAVLEAQKLTVRDETGWKLSTTRAASLVMAWLRASTWQPELRAYASDAVLNALKLTAAVAGSTVAASDVQQLEAHLRRCSLVAWPTQVYWQGVEGLADSAVALIELVQRMVQQLSGERSLSQWQACLRAVLEQLGVWQSLQTDVAGDALCSALYLHDHAPALHHSPTHLGQAQFVQWVHTVLEASSFKPPYPLQEQVVIVPLSQLLARDFAAVVIPACTVQNLPASPEPPGAWTVKQRELLGLPSRAQLQQAQRAAWQHALQFPSVDLLMSHSDGAGGVFLPSPLVLEWELVHGLDKVEQGLHWRRVESALAEAPDAHGDGLALPRMSASSYDSLRACPYKFYAQYLLGLREVTELEGGVDRRDFGLWVHALLQKFHDDCRRDHVDPTTASDLEQRMDAAQAYASAQLGLDAIDTVPWEVNWPLLRTGYLAWWREQAQVSSYQSGEKHIARHLSELQDGVSVDVRLVGQIDRVDRLQDGRPLLLDYKTESTARTRARIDNLWEDTQLAFYAALSLPDDVQAGYVNVGERGTTQLYQPEADAVAEVRDAVLNGLVQDLRRIQQGDQLPALGEGAACTYCAVRGLCRRDFWR